ncbi:MAG: HEAT repeat domain-containing protein [Flavobacteriales bacterium]
MNIENYIKKYKKQFEPDIPTDLDKDFEALLDKEFPQTFNRKKRIIWMSGIVASLILLLVLTMVFQKNTIEKNILLAMSNENSSMDRLKGVYKYQELQTEDDQFIDKLIELLYKDENNNVKIATIDALKAFPDNEKVRKALIKALEKEEEPIIQIELIKAISELREKRAKPSLQKVINDRKTIDYVKESALYTYNQLK